MLSNFDLLQSSIKPYHLFLYCNCGLIASMYPICIYLLFFTKIKLNIAYKFMLLGCATTTFINSILYCLWAPILTPYFFGGIVTGIFRNLNANINLHIFKAALIILTNSELCTIMLLVFQYSNLQESAFLAKFGKTSKRLLMTYFCYLMFSVFVVLIFTPFSVNDVSAFSRIANDSNNSFAKELSARNVTFLSFISSLNPVSYILGSVEIISSAFLFLLGFYYTLKLSFVISETKNLVSLQTYRLQIMLLRAFLFKTFMMFIFYALPMTAYTASLWLKIEYPLFGMFCNITMVSHGWISYFGTIALIRPYRNHLLGIIFRTKFRSGSYDTSSSVAPTTAQRTITHFEKSIINA